MNPRMTQGAAKKNTSPVMKMPTLCDEPGTALTEIAGVEEVMQRAEDRSAGATGIKQRVGEAGEGVPPETEGHVEREDGPGHLDGVVADAAPGHPVAHGGLEPPEEAGSAHERLGLLDVLTEQGVRDAALPAAEAAGAAQGQGEQAQAEECDGQDGAEEHGAADENETDGGQAAGEQVVRQLGPGAAGERLTQDAAGQRTDLGHLLFGEGDRHLLTPYSRRNLVVAGLLHHHASLLASSTPPASTATAV